MKIKESELKNLIKKITTKVLSESVDQEEQFVVHGTYTLGNAGGYEIMISDDGDSARIRDAWGSNNPKTSDWLPIEYVDNEETGELEPVIDPEGYDIPLNMTMRVNRFNETKELKEVSQETARQAANSVAKILNTDETNIIDTDKREQQYDKFVTYQSPELKKYFDKLNLVKILNNRDGFLLTFEPVINYQDFRFKINVKKNDYNFLTNINLNTLGDNYKRMLSRVIKLLQQQLPDNVTESKKAISIKESELTNLIERLILSESKMNEKWGKKLKIHNTGEHADKTIADLKKELSMLKEKSKKYQDDGKKVPESIKNQEKEIMFAIKAKKNWRGRVKESVLDGDIDYLYAKYGKKYPYACDLISYFIFGNNKDSDNIIYKAVNGAYGRNTEVDESEVSQLMLDNEYSYENNIEYLDDAVRRVKTRNNKDLEFYY